MLGDIHGDLAALEAGLAVAGDDDTIVFLGDYADRGPDGIEVIERIDQAERSDPKHVVALMGNHEWYTPHGQPTFQPCTLISEVEAKRGSWAGFFSFFSSFVARLSISALIPEAALLVHAGIHPSLVDLESLSAPGEEAFTDVVWSDPGTEDGLRPNPRGIGHRFGPDVTGGVTSALGIRYIVRSHQPSRAKHGPAYDHDKRIITISSTGVYGGVPHVLIFDARGEFSIVEV